MQTMTPTHKFDYPGIGLRDNGRRVLTYSDLRSTFLDPDGREPSRTIARHLTGHMEKYSWTFDGIKFSAAELLRTKYGERVRIPLVNDRSDRRRVGKGGISTGRSRGRQRHKNK